MEFSHGIRKYLAGHIKTVRVSGSKVRIANCINTLQRCAQYVKTDQFRKLVGMKEYEAYWIQCGLTDYNSERLLTRKELSILLDKSILLFGSKNLPMDINGKMSFKYSEF